MSSTPAPFAPFLLQTHWLSGGPAGQAVIDKLSFGWPAGVHWVYGDEGCGKTTLLRLLSGDLKPQTGSVQAPLGGVFWADLQASEHDHTTVQACWDTLQAKHPLWSVALMQDLCEALDMERHRDKPLYMLSTGSRRKVVLIAAMASGATVTLLDQPFVSLDRTSVQVIEAFLCDAATVPNRAWIVADYEVPADLPQTSVLKMT